MEPVHRVVVVGGGFGGLHTVQSLKRSPVQVTLVDRRNFHLFQPLLYQVATGALSPANIAAPLRGILRRQRNAEVVLGEVVDFALDRKELILTDGRIPFDSLIVAAGSRYNYFGHEEWEPRAPALKTVEDATSIRGRILRAFEEAERETDPEQRRRWLTFVIVGAGPTGVEMAGALAEVANHTLRNDFRHINPSEARIIIVDAVDRVLSNYPESLSQKAVDALETLGITVWTKCLVTNVAPEAVMLRTGDRQETIPARTVIWAAGVRTTPLAKALADASGAETDRIGRVTVQSDLSLPGHPDVFVIGDMAHCRGEDGQPLPGVAPVAIQQGKYVARLIHARLQGQTLPAFRYRDLGTMAAIGRSQAVVNLKWLKTNGVLAWLIWLFVHLMQLVEFQNRVLVFMQWAWNYFTLNRSARLITGEFAASDRTESRKEHEPAAGARP